MDSESLREYIDVKLKTCKNDEEYSELYKKIEAMSLEEIVFEGAIKGNKNLSANGKSVLNLNTELLIRILLAINVINKKLKI